ncbi:alpha/beta hydrolase [Dactylosporangium sp. NPDC000244]|uniref:alpha/beta hydrolase n=1 Tax=Dactylosporangium sp. NPDC000244 TaxID=3154365 RepID=UPI0033177421
MTELLPPTRRRPTVTYADCAYSVVPGFRPLCLDVHLPEGDGPFPVLVYVHGGGWRAGSRVSLPSSISPHRFHERFLAHGYAVADVDYRLSGEAQFPAQLVDVQAALRWLHHHAAQLNLDPARFAALGESAGAHLACLAGLLGRDDASLRAVVNWYGPTDLRLYAGASLEGALADLLGGELVERTEFAAWASPMSHVHQEAPPFLNVYGTADEVVFLSDGVAFTKALQAQGVRAELVVVEGAAHCFNGHDDIGGLIEQSADFLDDVLKGRC